MRPHAAPWLGAAGALALAASCGRTAGFVERPGSGSSDAHASPFGDAGERLDGGRADASLPGRDAGTFDASRPDAAIVCACDDLNPCTLDWCDANQICRHEPELDGAGCALGLCCGGECVSIDTDPAHCGGCASTCQNGQRCWGGSCRACTQAFGDRADYATPPDAWSLGAGDFDGDALPDLAVTAYGLGKVSILYNQGAGKFGGRVDHKVAANTKHLAVGDLDGDGKPDLVVTAASQVYLLLNRNGTFDLPVELASAADALGVAIGDVSGDRRADIVFTPQGGSKLFVLLNQGQGTFAPKVEYWTGGQPMDVTLGDLNRDGLLDVAVVAIDNQSLGVRLGMGQGAFGEETKYGVGKGPWAVTLADVDADGLLDVLVANRYGDSVSVFRGKGDGTLLPRADVATAKGPHGVTVADVNGDGRAELVVPNWGVGSASVFSGPGDGTFPTRVDYPAAPNSTPFAALVGDFSGDGAPDLVVSNGDADSVSVRLGVCY